MIPVVMCCSVDEVLRSSVTGGLALDVPGAVVITHDIDVETATLRRRVHDVTSAIQDRTRPLAHPCLGCALREDIVPAIREVALRGPSAIVLALPLTAEPVPVLRALDKLADEGVVAPGAVITTLDTTDLLWDIYGDDLLRERGLALGAQDSRALGEVLARQIESSDVVVYASSVTDTGRAADASGEEEAAEARVLLAHLCSAQVVTLHEVDAAQALALRDRDEVRRRGDPRRVSAQGAADERGIWTIELASWKPFHPGRLRDRLQVLGQGRSRGVFWLPSRPDLVAHWDGAGGQLGLGSHGTWWAAGCEPTTRVVVTGIDSDADEVVAAFETALMTDAELAAGLACWIGTDDGYDPWLGARRDVA